MPSPPQRNRQGSTAWITPQYAYAVLFHTLLTATVDEAAAHDGDGVLLPMQTVFDPFPDRTRRCLSIAHRAAVAVLELWRSNRRLMRPDGGEGDRERPASGRGKRKRGGSEADTDPPPTPPVPRWQTVPDGIANWDYQTVPPGADIIITNPPFDVKGDVLTALVPLGLPVCLLLPLECLTVSAFQEMSRHSHMHVIIPRRRFYFLPPPEASSAYPATAGGGGGGGSSSSGGGSNRCSFSTAWFCYNVPYLPVNGVTFAFYPALNDLYRPDGDGVVVPTPSAPSTDPNDE